MKNMFFGCILALALTAIANPVVAGPVTTYVVPNFGAVTIDGNSATIGGKTYEMDGNLAGGWYIDVSADGKHMTITNKCEPTWTGTGKRDESV